MKKYSIILISLISLTLLACGGAKEQKQEGEKSDEKENAAALTYRQFYEIMFEDYKNRLEWHEDDFNQTEKASITLTDRDNCETENCGKKTYVKNNSADKTIRVVIKTSFSIPNTLPYIANQFILAPGDEVYLTCTQFCFGGETYDLANEIVVAEVNAD